MTEHECNPHRRIPAATVRSICGDVSDMTIWRWLNNPILDFPKPQYIGRRRYWREAEVIKWLEDSGVGVTREMANCSGGQELSDSEANNRIQALEAENARLRNALKPFARAADGRRSKGSKGIHCFSQGFLLAARAALQEADNG